MIALPIEHSFFWLESGPSHGKPAQKRENGGHPVAGSSSSASGMQGNNMNRRPQYHR